MSSLLPTAIRSMLLVLAPLPGAAQTILGVSFDITGSANLAAYDTLADGTVVRTGTNGPDTWNQATGTGAGTLTLPNLFLADGTATTASVSIGRRNASNLGGAFDITGKPGATDDHAMMDGCFIIDGDDGDTLSFSGLPASVSASGFTLNLHTTHADTRTSSFTVNGLSGSSQQPSSATFDGDFAGYTASIPIAAGMTDFTVTWTANAGNPNRVNLAGISITPPEPPRISATTGGFWEEIVWSEEGGPPLSGDLPDSTTALVGRHLEVVYRGVPASETVATLLLGENSVNPGQGRLTVESGSLQVSGDLWVGRNVSANDSFLQIDGGSLAVAGDALFGRNAPSADGSLTLSGGSFSVGGDLLMGVFNRGGSMIRFHNPGASPAIQVGGAVALDRCSLDLTFDASYTHVPGNEITLLEYASRRGQFLNFREGEEFNCGPHRFRIHYDDTPGTITLTALPNWPASATRPHIILLFADDQGISDLSINGDANFPMPALESLAASGARFTDAYVTGGVCHPSRCGLLTGRYQHRYANEGNLPNPSTDGMSVRQRTVPRLLQGLGYRTYGIGKWHLGFNVEYHPNLRGFDRWYGMWSGARSYYASTTEINVFQDQMTPDFSAEETPVYVTDRIGNKAVEMIDEHLASASGDPLFMYVSFTAVHAPMDINPADPRFARLQNEFGLTAADYANSSFVFPGSNQATTDQNRYELAAMTLAMDENIGKILAKLEEEDIADNTLVVYMNDNGGAGWTAQFGGNFSYNTPFRGFKGESMTEGSIRVPCVASWPGVISPGGVVSTPISALDWAATFVNAGADAPVQARNGLEGLDLAPSLSGTGSLPEDRVLCWRAGAVSTSGGAAVRMGAWKLLIDNATDSGALYHLPSDPGETTDLSASQPAIKEALRQRFVAWEARTQPAYYNNSGNTMTDPGLERWAAAGGQLMRSDSTTPLWISGSFREPVSWDSDFQLSFHLQASESGNHEPGAGLWAGIGPSADRSSLIRMGIDYFQSALVIQQGAGGPIASTAIPHPQNEVVELNAKYDAGSGDLSLTLGEATATLTLAGLSSDYGTMAVGVSAMTGEAGYPHRVPSPGSGAFTPGPPTSLRFTLGAEPDHDVALSASSDLVAFPLEDGALIESLGGGHYQVSPEPTSESRRFYRLQSDR